MKRAAKIVTATCVALLLPAGAANATQTATPKTLVFPATPAGTESAAQTVTYTIDGAETYRNVFPQGNLDSCSIMTGTCTFPYTTTCAVQPALFGPGPQTCTYSVRFTPTGPGSVAGTLRITPTTVVTLSGTGVAAPTSGKGKKCGKKKGKKSASAAKKRKCGKKK